MLPLLLVRLRFVLIAFNCQNDLAVLDHTLTQTSIPLICQQISKLHGLVEVS
jgi:hypothetical protein